MKRRDFLSLTVGAAGAGALLPAAGCGGPGAPDRPHLLLFTGDDLSYQVVGANGCPLPDITPAMDRLAGQGLRFSLSHATIAACQPSRSVVMTGRYPLHNGAEGFEPIRSDVPTLIEILREAGYTTACLGKVEHLEPREKFVWDLGLKAEALGHGRDPALYARAAAGFIREARRAGRPFCLLANPMDAHRPFAGSLAERRNFDDTPPEDYPKPSRMFQPLEVPLPGFLPDLPGVRAEYADYLSSVRRCDDILAAVLAALDDAGEAPYTLVALLSDHGMGFPFAKTNCYVSSTHIPTMVRWPGMVAPGQVDGRHFLSGIDFLPTLLEAVDLPVPDGVDGRSFLPLLRGEGQEGRDHVFTVFHRNNAETDLQMRAIHTTRDSYIYNAWATGDLLFRSGLGVNRTMAALSRAADRGNEAVAGRLRFLLARVPEEYYDLVADPDCLDNLADAPASRQRVDERRSRLLEFLATTGDPLAATFEARIRS